MSSLITKIKATDSARRIPAFPAAFHLLQLEVGQGLAMLGRSKFPYGTIGTNLELEDKTMEIRIQNPEKIQDSPQNDDLSKLGTPRAPKTWVSDVFLHGDDQFWVILRCPLKE